MSAPAKFKSGGGRRFSPERFRAMALTILITVDIDPRLLYEVMFAADMEAYRQLGQSITGTTWVKTGNGVEPRPPRRRKPSDSPTHGAKRSTGSRSASKASTGSKRRKAGATKRKRG